MTITNTPDDQTQGVPRTVTPIRSVTIAITTPDCVRRDWTNSSVNRMCGKISASPCKPPKSAVNSGSRRYLWPAWVGKTTLANIIAEEMGATIKVTSGPRR